MDDLRDHCRGLTICPLCLRRSGRSQALSARVDMTCYLARMDGQGATAGTPGGSCLDAQRR
jgi:hypothetical protein